jgi:hypothetical protein
VRPSILALLERLPQTAAIVVSATFEVLAWNDLAAALLEDFAALAPGDRNLARKAFLGRARPGAALYGISDVAEFRHRVVTELRSTLARYPSDPAVSGLVKELRDGSPEFTRLWERHDVQAAPTLRKTFLHPAVGEITLDCDSLKLTDRDQHLVLYTAPQGSHDADALALLHMLGAEGISSASAAQRMSLSLCAASQPPTSATASASAANAAEYEVAVAMAPAANAPSPVPA